MRVLRFAAFAACGVLLSGCLTAEETVLSTNQKVAMVYSPGDSISPPANLVLLANRHGQYVPVATGFGQAPIPAALNGAVAGAAVGTGIYGAARVVKPPVTNISNTVTGATGGSGGNSNSTSASISNGSGVNTGNANATSTTTQTSCGNVTGGAGSTCF